MFVLLVIVNVLVFLHESNLGPAALRQFVWKYAFIPSKLGFTDASMAVRVPADLFQKISPMVTSQFLHAGPLSGPPDAEVTLAAFENIYNAVLNGNTHPKAEPSWATRPWLPAESYQEPVEEIRCLGGEVLPFQA